MTIRALEIASAARARRVALAGETVGYLVLGWTEELARLHRHVTLRDLALSPDGSVSILGGSAANSAEAEADLRAALAELLSVARPLPPALLRVAQRQESVGVDALAKEIATALIPLNRGASRRALARLEREMQEALAQWPLDPGDEISEAVVPPPASDVGPAPISPAPVNLALFTKAPCPAPERPMEESPDAQWAVPELQIPATLVEPRRTLAPIAADHTPMWGTDIAEALREEPEDERTDPMPAVEFTVELPPAEPVAPSVAFDSVAEPLVVNVEADVATEDSEVTTSGTARTEPIAAADPSTTQLPAAGARGPDCERILDRTARLPPVENSVRPESAPAVAESCDSKPCERPELSHTPVMQQLTTEPLTLAPLAVGACATESFEAEPLDLEGGSSPKSEVLSSAPSLAELVREAVTLDPGDVILLEPTVPLALPAVVSETSAEMPPTVEADDVSAAGSTGSLLAGDAGSPACTGSYVACLPEVAPRELAEDGEPAIDDEGVAAEVELAEVELAEVELAASIDDEAPALCERAEEASSAADGPRAELARAAELEHAASLDESERELGEGDPCVEPVMEVDAEAASEAPVTGSDPAATDAAAEPASAAAPAASRAEDAGGTAAASELSFDLSEFEDDALTRPFLLTVKRGARAIDAAECALVAPISEAALDSSSEAPPSEAPPGVEFISEAQPRGSASLSDAAAAPASFAPEVDTLPPPSFEAAFRAPAVFPPVTSEVEHLLSGFSVADVETTQDLCSRLDALAGLDATPAPPPLRAVPIIAIE
jgi:hypothetical protein